MPVEAEAPLTPEQAAFLETLARVRLSHPDNLCARFLTEALFLSYSPPARERLMACCRSGAENPDSLVGCYVLEPDDLVDFAAFFDPLIRAHHAQPGAHSTVGAALSRDLTARVRVGRNLEGYRLPAMMDRDERLRLEGTLTQALRGLVDDPALGGRVISLASGLAEADYQAMVDAGLAPQQMDEDSYMRSAGLADDWPHGRAAYFSADQSLIVWVGEEDHLRVIGMTTGDGLEQAMARVAEVLGRLEAAPGVRFLRREGYGFVTSCPSNLGSGFKPSIRARLPRLGRAGTDARALCRRFGLTASGLAGDRSPIGRGGAVNLSPIRRLGVEDREMLGALRRGVAALSAALAS